jgi:cellulose biosynthesis protein BcsQ
MNSKSIYVAFSNQKGGAGKSAFTTLAASCLHYAGGKNVAVIDCDYPQHSIFAMRERDRSFVMANDRLKVLACSQFQQLDKKAYSIFNAKPENALETVRKYLV